MKPEVRKLRANQGEVKYLHAEEIDKKPVVDEASQTIKEYEDLQIDLAKYLDNLDHVEQRAEKFFGDIEKINDWAPDAEDRIQKCESKSKDPEDLKKELEELNSIANDIDRKQPTVFAIGDNGQWLEKNTPENQTLAGEIPQQVAEVDAIMSNLDDELNARRARIKTILADALSFEEALGEFDKWLAVTEKKLDSEKPITTDLDKVKEQVQEHKPLHEDIEQHDAVYNSLLYSAKPLIGRKPVNDDTNKSDQLLSDKLQSLSDRYNTVNARSKKRDDDLDKMVPVLRAFVEDNKSVDDAIEDGEKTLKNVEPIAFNVDEGNDLLREVKVGILLRSSLRSCDVVFIKDSLIMNYTSQDRWRIHLNSRTCLFIFQKGQSLLFFPLILLIIGRLISIELNRHSR